MAAREMVRVIWEQHTSFKMARSSMIHNSEMTFWLIFANVFYYFKMTDHFHWLATLAAN